MEILFSLSPYVISVVPDLDLTKQFMHPETAPPNLIKLIEAIEQSGNTFVSLNVMYSALLFVVCLLEKLTHDTQNSKSRANRASCHKKRAKIKTDTVQILVF